MKRILVAGSVVLLCLAFALPALAETQKRPTKEFYFGDSFHKSPAGIKLTYLEIKWDETGATELNFEISAWKGKVVWEDLLLVCTCPDKGKPETVYKLSKSQKMGLEFCYLECLHKAYHDRMIFAPPVKPFNGETGQVWFIFRHGGQYYHVVWDLSSNTAEWYKAEDKPIPPGCEPTCPSHT